MPQPRSQTRLSNTSISILAVLGALYFRQLLIDVEDFKSFTVLNDGCHLLGEIYAEVAALQAWSDIHSISLPVQRELVDAKLELCHLLTEILEVELERIAEKNESDLTKERAVKVCTDRKNLSVYILYI